MIMSNYLRTWEGTQFENKFNRLIIICLVITVMFLAVKLANSEKILTFQPVTLSQDSWVTEKSGSQSYKEGWAMYLAQVTGNVTPKTLDFIKQRVTPFLAPSIFNDVVEALEIQAANIREDRITMRFEPRFVEYEESSDKVFVYGYSYVSGSMDKEKKSDRTYEYQIKINQYAPLVTHIDTYAGKPMNEAAIKRKTQKSERNND
jgi:conjugal transfer pilus assembly protein TraE